MTGQELISSSPQESPPNISPSRFTLIAAVGIMGTEDDCRNFMEMMLADFNNRCAQANKRIFRNRITLLPVEETLP